MNVVGKLKVKVGGPSLKMSFTSGLNNNVEKEHA